MTSEFKLVKKSSVKPKPQNDMLKSLIKDQKIPLTNDNVIVVKKSMTDNYIISTKQDEAKFLAENHNCPVYEYLGDIENFNKTFAFYMDFDIKISNYVKTFNYEMFGDLYWQIIDKIKARLANYTKTILDDCDFYAPMRLSKRVDNKGKEYLKASYHVINQKIAFSSLAEIKSVVEGINTTFTIDNQTISFNDKEIDTSVYGANRKFRLPYCVKENCGEETVLIFNENIYQEFKPTTQEFISKCFITNPQNAEIIKVPINAPQKKLKNVVADNKIVTNLKSKYFIDLCEKLPIKYIENHDLWIKLMYICRNYCYDIDAAIVVSKRASNYSESDKQIEAVFKDVNDSENNRATIKSLFKWLKDENIDTKDLQQKYYEMKIAENRNKFLNPEYKKTFSQVCKNTISKCEKTNYPQYKIANQLQKVLGTIDGKKLPYIKKRYRSSTTTTNEKKLTKVVQAECNTKDLLSEYQYVIEIKKIIGDKEVITKKKTNFYEIYKKFTKTFKYESYGFYPESYGEDDLINTFSGFVSKPIDNGDPNNKEYLKRFREHILNIYCKGNTTYADFVEKFFGFMLKFPGKKSKVCIVVRSDKQQVGKGLIPKFFSKYIMGEYYTSQSNSLKELIGDFSGGLNDKLLINLDEVNSNGKNIDGEGILKSIITEEVQRCAKKHQDWTDSISHTNIIITSNSQNPAPISSGNARYFVLECSEEKQCDTKYFNDLEEAFMKGADYIHMYLKSLDIDQFAYCKTMPHTETEKEMLTLTTFDQFILDIYDNLNGDQSVNFFIYEGENEYKFSDLDKWYKTSYESHGKIGEYCSKMKFINKLKTVFRTESKQNQYYYKITKISAHNYLVKSGIL